eukprot:6488115-Alexandrium_andersonii.AAC.1
MGGAPPRRATNKEGPGTNFVSWVFRSPRPGLLSLLAGKRSVIVASSFAQRLLRSIHSCQERRRAR